MKIKNTIIAHGKWGKNYTVGRSQKVSGIVIHYTASNASALNNLKYFASRYVGASAHYFVDANGNISQSVKQGDTAWSVGAKSYKHKTLRNSNTISIEVVNDGKSAFTAAQITTLKSMVSDLRKKYVISASNVVRHYDITGKQCPAYYVNAARWKSLHSKITGSTTTPAKKPAAKAPAKKPAIYTLTQVLKRGMKGTAVIKLQQRLVALKTVPTPGVIDGKFGDKTVKSVKAFQKSKKLTQDGQVGKNTAKALGWKWGAK